MVVVVGVAERTEEADARSATAYSDAVRHGRRGFFVAGNVGKPPASAFFLLMPRMPWLCGLRAIMQQLITEHGFRNRAAWEGGAVAEM